MAGLNNRLAFLVDKVHSDGYHDDDYNDYHDDGNNGYDDDVDDYHDDGDFDFDFDEDDNFDDKGDQCAVLWRTFV